MRVFHPTLKRPNDGCHSRSFDTFRFLALRDTHALGDHVLREALPDTLSTFCAKTLGNDALDQAA